MEATLPVTLVVDTEFGSRINRLVEGSDVWLVQSQQNSEACRETWSTADKSTIRINGSLSAFAPQGPAKEDWACDAINLIEQHHGKYAQANPYTSLVVIGAKPTSLITETLAEIGFCNIEETQDGFIAIRSACEA